MTPAELTTLQALIWPDATLSADPALTVRLGGGTALLAEGHGLACPDGGSIGFDTAFNLFPLHKWRSLCDLQDLRIALRGRGTFVLRVMALATKPKPGQKSPEKIRTGKQRFARQILPREVLTRTLTFEGDALHQIDLSPLLDTIPESALAVLLVAKGAAELATCLWQTGQPPLRLPRLVLGITTFRREAAVAATVARFVAFAAQDSCGAHLHLVVVDNGQSASLPASDRVTLIASRNLGGAGGFARCLREALALGASHALFMDDDARVDMQAIARVWSFLAFATDPATTVIGGLTQAADPTLLWESGAVFRQVCRPQYRDLDLTDPGSFVALEEPPKAPNPANFYGGFWFYAFPLAAVRHWPFPFFVRGDDINFSLANPFRFVTLPGVVSFQSEDFADKESSLTLYLDLRNHLIQHLALPKMALGTLGLLLIPAFFFARSFIQTHLDSLESLNLAVEDVMRGPAFFASNADLSQRRAEIARLRQSEIWRPIEEALPTPRQVINPQSIPQRLALMLTLNGLLLPFFARWGNRLVLTRGQRGLTRLCWGAAQITYVDAENHRVMTISHDKRRGFRLGLQSMRNLFRLARAHARLRREWQAGFASLTTEEFWEKQFFTDGE